MNTILEYTAKFKLKNDVTLKQLLFSHEEYRWIYEYLFVKKVQKSRLPALSNTVKIIIEYHKGILSNLEVTMDIINHKNRGKKFVAGADVSANSHVFLQVCYRLSDDKKAWIVTEITKGVNQIWDEKDEHDQLPIRVIKLPFPIQDRIEIDYGSIMVPFLTNDEEIKHVRIGTSICKII